MPILRRGLTAARALGALASVAYLAGCTGAADTTAGSLPLPPGSRVAASHYGPGVEGNDRIDHILVFGPEAWRASMLLAEQTQLLRGAGWDLRHRVERCNGPSDRGVTDGRVHFCRPFNDIQGYSPDRRVFITIDDERACGRRALKSADETSGPAICVTLAAA